MTLSHQGDGIGLSWDFNAPMTRWFNYREYYPQPVFAAPNYVERMNNSLMGLMVPDVQEEAQENKPMADVPMELHIGQYVDLEAELFLVKGNSMDVMCDWVRRKGLPELTNPRWGLEEALDHIANAFNTNLWHEGQGFGIVQRESDKPSKVAREFLRRYVAEHPGTQIAKELAEKIAWCDAQKVKAHRGHIPDVIRRENLSPEELEDLKARERRSSPGRGRTAPSGSSPTDAIIPRTTSGWPGPLSSPWAWIRTPRCISAPCPLSSC